MITKHFHFIYFREIDPPGKLAETNGAMFGSSVACLGLSDKGDQRMMVAVGSPNYGLDNQGAVFVYRSKSKLASTPSQIIKSLGGIITGFGMKLSDVKTDIDGVTDGISVGSPNQDAITYIHVRTVVRFKEMFEFKMEPNYIDPVKEDQEIVLSLTPKIEKLSSYSNDLIAKVTVSTDTSRLEPGQDLTQTATFTRGQTSSEPILFSFSLMEALRDQFRNSNLDNKKFKPIR